MQQCVLSPLPFLLSYRSLLDCSGSLIFKSLLLLFAQKCGKNISLETHKAFFFFAILNVAALLLLKYIQGMKESDVDRFIHSLTEVLLDMLAEYF